MARRDRSSTTRSSRRSTLAAVGVAAALALAFLPQGAQAILPNPPKNVTGAVVPTSDDQCHFNYRLRRCEPVEHCQYKYRFLDATFGESCRLKGERKHVKPFYKSKITGHPGLIAAGATALFGLDIAAIIFTPLLQNFPITFNLVQGFILCLAGDTYFQILEQGAFSVNRVGVKAWRTVRSGLIGALNNGLIHYLYYKWIDRRFPYHLFTEERFGKPDSTYYKLSVAWFKYWIEWPTIGVYKIASMMFLTAALGGDLKGLPAKFKKRFLLTWLRSLQVWPVYDTILYAYVPASHRPLFNTFMSILWGGYLSHISQAEGEMAAEGVVEDGEGIALLDAVKGAAHKVEDTLKRGAHKVEEAVHQAEDALKKGAHAVEEGIEHAAHKVGEAFDELGEIVNDAALDGEEEELALEDEGDLEDADFFEFDDEEDADEGVWEEDVDDEDIAATHTHEAGGRARKVKEEL